jgi:hypothetical protein
MAGQRIAVIVEGDGEVAAVPVLLRRIAGEGLGRWDVVVGPPHRHGRGSLTTVGGIERIVERAAIMDWDAGGILVVIDADDDCPATLGPQLLERAKRARPDRRIALVLANREFEAWFLAAAPSLSGHRGLGKDLKAPGDPERPRDCKGWLTGHRVDGGRYRPTVDQAALAGVFDLEMARANSRSFDKFCRDVEWLVTGGTT